MHFEYICEACSSGLMRVGLDTSDNACVILSRVLFLTRTLVCADVPVIFGVLTCLTIEQSRERSGLTGRSYALFQCELDLSMVTLAAVCRRRT